MRSKCLILTFIYIVSFHSLFSQTPEWELGDNTGGYFTALYEENNGDLIAVMAPKNNLTKIVKLDKDGQQLDFGFIEKETMMISILKIIKIKSKNEYILIGNSNVKNEDDSFTRNFIVTVIDFDLNVKTINVNPFDVQGNLFNMNYYITNDEQIFVSINVFNPGLGPNSEQIFTRLNNKGDIEYSYIDNGFNCYSIIKTNDQYECIGRNIKTFDENFNFIGKRDEVYFIMTTSNQNRTERINENKLLIGSSSSMVPELELGGAILYYVDNDLNILKKNWIKTPFGPTLANNTFDISPDSSIFLATFEAPSSGYKNISVGKFDIDLNLIWQIQFENLNQHRYLLWGMEATNDNGVLIYGSRRSWNGDDAQSYIIKFNSEGNVTWTNNLDDKLKKIKSYPNPSSGLLTIELEGINELVDIRLFDLSGRNVFVHQNMSESKVTLDLSALSAGQYINKIYKNGKEINSGQWIKIE